MSHVGRTRLVGLGVAGIVVVLAAIWVPQSVVRADSYPPFCEAPILQCASADRLPHGGETSFQLYPSQRCIALINEVTTGLTLVVRQVASDPAYVTKVALKLHDIAHFCPYLGYAP